MLGPLFALASLTAASAQHLNLSPQNHALSSTRSITKRCADDVLPPAEYTLKLGSKVQRPEYKHAAYEAFQNSLRRGAQVGPYDGTIAGADYDQEYLTKIKVGGKAFKVIVDTGSSDTWLVEDGFKCYTLADKPVSQAKCNFGAVFNASASATYVPVKNKNFNISYGDNEFLNGVVATETVEIAGMTVKDQTIGVVNKAAWNGDGVSAGLMGLAYESLTSVYNGTDPTKDSASNWDPYNPLFYTAIDSGVLKTHLFSIALNRGSFASESNSTYDPDLGAIGFGGIVDVPVENLTAVAPIQKYHFRTRGVNYAYYTINVTYEGPGSHETKQETILDSGTTLAYIPNHLAEKYAAAWKPPATYNKAEEGYVVDCNATAPEFTVNIGGKKFPISAADQILPAGKDKQGNTICITGIQPGGTIKSGSVFILGDTFLHNVVMTFNPDHEEVFITKRKPY